MVCDQIEKAINDVQMVSASDLSPCLLLMFYSQSYYLIIIISTMATSAPHNGLRGPSTW